jgi:hypothetical protein
MVTSLGAMALSQFFTTKIHKNSRVYQPFYCCGWKCLNELQSTVEVARKPVCERPVRRWPTHVVL